MPDEKANLRPDNDGLEPLTGLDGTGLQQSGINNTKNKKTTIRNNGIQFQRD